MNTTNGDRFGALLRHAVKSAPMPEPPVDFARNTARRARDHTEEAGVEIWITRILLALAAVFAAAITIPFLEMATGRIMQLLGDAPWPLLFVAAAVFAGMRLMEFRRPIVVPG